MTTHRERIQACLNGETPDRTPIALWRHFPVDDQNPETLAASTLHFQNTYDFDIVKVTPASSFAVKDWGVEDKWMGDAEGSRRYTKRVIHKPGDWEKLSVLEPTSPHLAGQLYCLRLLRKNLSPETPLIQTIFNPLSQAKNLAGNETLLAHLREEPEAVMKGLDTIAKTTSKFIEAAREIGIDGIFYAIQHAQADLLELNEYKTLACLTIKQSLNQQMICGATCSICMARMCSSHCCVCSIFRSSTGMTARRIRHWLKRRVFSRARYAEA